MHLRGPRGLEQVTFVILRDRTTVKLTGALSSGWIPECISNMSETQSAGFAAQLGTRLGGETAAADARLMHRE
jgi:hypothetical protein